jgi:hypothetical protein
MPVNDSIRIPDFNTIRNLAISVMSTGSATQGYGQQIFSIGEIDGSLVDKANWDALRYDIVNAIVHQTGSLPSIVIPNEGDLVRYDANQPNFQYLTLANQANTNRFDIGAGQFATEPGPTVTGSVNFSTSVSSSVTVSFATANEARYFFNSGGKIRFTSSFANTLSTAQSISWGPMLTSLSETPPSFGGNSPAVNFYTLTSSNQTWYSQGTSGTYNSNRWTLQARCNVSNNSSGTATSITFTAIWQDLYTDPGSPPPGDQVIGSFTLSANHIRAVGALYPNLTARSFNAPTPSYSAISAPA